MLGLVERKWGFGRPWGYRERIWKGLGWLRGGWGLGSGSKMGPTWAKLEPTLGQHGPNLSQLGANLGPCWVQIGSSRPSCSHHEGILRPLGACPAQDAKNDSKIIEFSSNNGPKLMLSKFPKSTYTLENVGPEANREKTTMKLKHIDVEAILEAILASCWGTWEAFGGHVGCLGSNLSQHKAILSHLGANLGPP